MPEERELGVDLEGLLQMFRGYRLRGYTIHEAAAALGVSTRTVFRWLKEGKLEGEKFKLATGAGYFWLIHPLSIARIQVRKEVEDQIRQEIEAKVKTKKRRKSQ